MSTTREQAMTALYNLLITAYSFGYTSRRPLPQTDLTTVEMPAMILIDDDESHTRRGQNVPAIRTITCAAWIFTSDASDPSSIPATTLNNILDAIDPVSGGVLKPAVGSGNFQTLGGLVSNCWVEGKITKDPGVLGKLGFAHVPMHILIP